MTARLHLETSGRPKLDVRDPVEYDVQKRLAKEVTHFIAAMDLKQLVAIADDNVRMELLRTRDDEDLKELRRIRATFRGLLSAQDHAKWVALRYGE